MAVQIFTNTYLNIVFVDFGYTLEQVPETVLLLLHVIVSVRGLNDDLEKDNLGAEPAERVVEADLVIPGLVYCGSVTVVWLPEIGNERNSAGLRDFETYFHFVLPSAVDDLDQGIKNI